MLAPRAQRPALAGLYALHMELARIPALAREPGLSAIRYHWWRDALHAALESDFADQPALALLLPALRDGAMALSEIERLIDALEAEAGEPRATDEAAFAANAEATTGRLFALGLTLLGAEHGFIGEFTTPAAIGWTWMAVLRNLAAAPGEVKRRYGVGARELAANAMSNLQALPPAPRRLAAVTLHARIARANLAALKRANYDLGACRWADQGGLLPAQLYWRTLTGRG